ncbi:MAG: hypothetical protein N2593_00020 [Patescibacteria group bacterium]|nr:hypothetical protein [Patescibacteria group bacterium]
MGNGCEGCPHLKTTEEAVERYGKDEKFETPTNIYKLFFGTLLAGFCGLADPKHPRMCLGDTYQQAKCPTRIEYMAKNN